MPLLFCISSTANCCTPFAAPIGRCLLLFAMLFAVGCDNNNTGQIKGTVAKEDPAGEFEWGMTRLDHALRNFRPSGSEGLATNRTLSYELFPPTADKSKYTARVTIATETAFLHAQREGVEKEEAPAAQPEIKLDDPLASKEDELVELVDIPGVGTSAPPVAPAQIETRSLDTESVFDMEYVQGKWKLVKQPELKHEQLWFEYAFE